MDLADLVHCAALTFLRSPALHFAVLGLVLFFASRDERASAPKADDRVQIPWVRASKIHARMAREQGRPLTDEEIAEANQILIDQEVLWLYSRELGLEHDPVVQVRLAQIAKFVAETPSEHATIESGAQAALEFGLADGDPVVRRIMIDAAERLIRATALVREPDDAGLQLYLDQHASDYQTERLTRITHITLNRNLRGDETETAAQAMLEDVVSRGVSPKQGTKLGDKSIVAPSLPALSDRSLERRFGRDFTIDLAELLVGSWQGPIRSKLGSHVVFVHERVPSQTAELSQVRDQVSHAARSELADRVLRVRLDELQRRYGVDVEAPPS